MSRPILTEDPRRGVVTRGVHRNSPISNVRWQSVWKQWRFFHLETRTKAIAMVSMTPSKGHVAAVARPPQARSRSQSNLISRMLLGDRNLHPLCLFLVARPVRHQHYCTPCMASIARLGTPPTFHRGTTCGGTQRTQVNAGTPASVERRRHTNRNTTNADKGDCYKIDRRLPKQNKILSDGG